MRKLLSITACAAAFFALSLPVSASGAGAVSFTQTFHNAVQTMPVPNPCTGAPGTVTLTYNGVAHATFLTSGVGAGTGWGTFTATGDFAFVPADPSQPSFSGKFTTWDGNNENLRNFTTTATFSLRGTGSDGSTLNFHDVAHITILNPLTNPTIVVSFDKFSCN